MRIGVTIRRLLSDVRLRVRYGGFLVMFLGGAILCASPLHRAEGAAIVAMVAIIGGVATVAIERATRSQWLRQEGLPARGELIALRDIGTVEATVFELDLRISRRGNAPYTVHMAKVVVPAREGVRLRVGQVVGVRVHPFDDEDVEVCWGEEPPQLHGAYRS